MRIKIDKYYEVPSTWAEMPLSMAAEIMAIEMPLHLKRYYDEMMAQKEPTKVTNTDWIKVFPDYYGKVISIMGKIPIDVINKTTHNDRIWLYTNYFQDLVLGLHFTPKLESFDLVSFVHEGEILVLPKTKDIMGNKIPMSNVTAFEFTECADLEIYSLDLKEGKFGVMANIVSILCRPEGEAYNEDICIKRAETLKDLRMDYVWEVFFCFNELLNLQTERDLTYLEETITLSQKLQPRKRGLVLGTGKLLTWAKRYKALKM